MCSAPKIPEDTSAQQAAEAAAKRQALVTQGAESIDTAFKPFDDAYFDKYRSAYVDNYNPQVDEQYGRAKTQLSYDAARKGVMDSTPAIYKDDLLNEKYGQQRQQIAANAVGAAQDQRSNIEQQKTNLYALNESAANPTLAAERSSAAAGTIPNTPQYSMLGDLFGGLINTGASYINGQSKALPAGYGSVFQAGAGLPGSSSGKVVR